MHAWFPASPCDTSCIRETAAAGGLRQAFRAGRLAVVVALALLVLVLLKLISLALPMRGLPAPVRHHCARLAARAVLWSLGVRLAVTGTIAERGLIVANHVSYLDILAIAAVRPARFVAKAEVLEMTRMAGWFGVIGVRRESIRSLPTAVADAAAALAQSTVAVFPEGTTWCGRTGGRFRPAFFQAAVDSGSVVSPVRLHYTDGETCCTTPAFIGADTIGETLRRILRAKSLTANLTCFPAVSSVAATRHDLARLCERLCVPAQSLTADALVSAPAAVGDVGDIVSARRSPVPPSQSSSGGRAAFAGSSSSKNVAGVRERAIIEVGNDARAAL